MIITYIEILGLNLIFYFVFGGIKAVNLQIATNWTTLTSHVGMKLVKKRKRPYGKLVLGLSILGYYRNCVEENPFFLFIYVWWNMFAPTVYCIWDVFRFHSCCFFFLFFSWKQTMTFRCLLACKKCSTVNVRGVYFNYKDLLSGT